MRNAVIIFCLLFLSGALAENYLINGGQQAQFDFTLEQKVVPPPQTSKLVLSFVVPKSFSSPTYNQNISNFSLSFSTEPKKQKTETDKRGNEIITAEWKNPHTIRSTIKYTAKNSTRLTPVNTLAPFPLKKVPRELKPYLSSTDQVPTKDKTIKKKAAEITQTAKIQFDAVQQILTWVVDKMNYVLTPEKYDALYSFRTGKGNCQNYSHLAAALMRSVGIPVRIVNGITLEKKYDIKTDNGILTMKMAQGRHSWIEVWFPDLKWVPFDPQQLEMFVSNRFIRAEVGVDNDETEKDGLIRWTTDKGIKLQPLFEENIEASFAVDDVNFVASKQNYGPKKLLFCPKIDANFTKKKVTPPPPPPPPVSDKELKTLRFIKPFLFGNLDFPKDLDFTSARGLASRDQSGDMKLKKGFLVETAEYVTTRGNQYAQTFILNKPVNIKQVGLALNIFGGDGQFWLELYKDNGEGQPGEYIATSGMRTIASAPKSPGYEWIDFDFGKDKILQPGRYWIAFGFTGSPVINWFFTYGKPVGPVDGTRYKTMFDDTWSRSLTYEFNYRVIGLAAE